MKEREDESKENVKYSDGRREGREKGRESTKG